MIRNYKLAMAPLLLMIAMGMSACSKISYIPVEATEVNKASAATTTDNPSEVKNPVKCEDDNTDPNRKCYTDIFKQPDSQTNSVDLLFVVDSSGSLLDERQKIVNGIQNYINNLPETADVNIAVMLAHGSTSALSGKLFKAAAEPIVLKSSELTNTQIKNFLATKMNQVVEDLDSDGGEEGMFSLFRGITTPSLLQASKDAGFFRTEAALSVVFVADENDICAVYPVGVTPVVDTDGREEPARIRDCEGLTAQGLTNQLKNLKGTKPLSVSGIIYAEQPVPAGGENEIGYGYTDMIALNAGIAIDIDKDVIETELGGIAEINAQQMMVQNEFTLSHTNIDEATLQVTVNDQNVPYILDGNTVIITQTVQAGSSVRISYCLKNYHDSNCKRCKHNKRKRIMINIHINNHIHVNGNIQGDVNINNQVLNSNLNSNLQNEMNKKKQDKKKKNQNKKKNNSEDSKTRMAYRQ
jgi:hypothetical protein